MDQELDLTSKNKCCSERDSFCVYKHFNPRSESDARAEEILDKTTLHNGSQYDVGMLCSEDIQTPNVFLITRAVEVTI